MRKSFFGTLIFSLVVVLSLLTSKVTAAKALIGTIRNTSVVSGCGCSFQLPHTSNNSNNCIFLSELDEKTAWINIDGRDTQFRLVSSTANPSREKIGQRATRRYKAGNVTVNLNRITTSVCKPSESGCEVTNYKATITAIKPNRQQTIKATGSCGC